MFRVIFQPRSRSRYKSKGIRPVLVPLAHCFETMQSIHIQSLMRHQTELVEVVSFIEEEIYMTRYSVILCLNSPYRFDIIGLPIASIPRVWEPNDDLEGTFEKAKSVESNAIPLIITFTEIANRYSRCSGLGFILLKRNRESLFPAAE